ncbi:winged helix-turn-helix transcriptional regulator [Marseilla massiliensis]|jgi:DNA-binding HxlR family transcriptional regulator|uniref:Helix-turn-helix transcriptional regulator n=1 Tax=Marseilla massiliensis TaxID=1841864 RepID=A0A938WUP3_9BACT|nr:helix-turn-helix domain-containing protein [Marseilla massiliensis]MBM6674971.1 helix-turn-helix transcriptional regulator [Marseilla massiliensis]CCY64998.1 transcriptional regulator HxlR family [Prevotella sp. CAG:1124]
MLKTEVNDALFPTCPIRNVLSRIGDKWSMLVLYTLEQHGVLRFNGLKLYIPDISKKMLSAALKVLEADGLISRKVYAEIPPKVEYTLTERGQTLIPLINNLIEWASANITDIVEDRKNFLIHNS